MKKIEKLLQRCISVFLSITILVQFMMSYPVSADVFSGTPGYNLPYHCSLKAISSLKWELAREIVKLVDENNDDIDLTWASNYFHNQVQAHIAAEHGVIPEQPFCHYSKTYDDGKTQGRADLSKTIDGYTYIWEVKPSVYCLNWTLRKNTFENQLDRYIDSDPSYRNGCKSGLDFGKETFFSIDHLFTITYEDTGNGLIGYEFDFILDKIKELVPATVWSAILLPKLKQLMPDLTDTDPGLQPDPVPGAAIAFYVPASVVAFIAIFGDMIAAQLANSRTSLMSLAYYVENASIKCKELCVAGLSKLPAKIGLASASALTLTVLTGCSTVPDQNGRESFKVSEEEKQVIDDAADVLWALGLLDDQYNPVDVNEDEIKDSISDIDSDDDAADDVVDKYEDKSGNDNKNNNDDKNSNDDDSEANDDDGMDVGDEKYDYDESKKQTTPRDPLIIHFSNEERIVLTNVENGVNFDLDNNGFAERTSWVGTEEGLLVIDLNNNGKIDNGGELFGDKFKMPNGNISSNGFEALQSLNSNDDLVIDKNDEVFDKLIVWFDRNHDGVSDAGELMTLSELDIVSIGLDWADDGIFYLDNDLNILESQSALVTFKDKTTKKISEFMFPVNTLDTTFRGVTTIGNVPDLLNVLEDDEDGILSDLFLAFGAERNIGKKRYYLKQILYKITGSADVDPRGRGDNIDARDLNVIEQFMGSKFDGADGKNPNTVAAATLKGVYASLEELYYNYVNFRSDFYDFRTKTYVRKTEKGFKYIDHSKVDAIFDGAIAKNKDIDVNIYDYGKYLIYLDKKHKTQSFEGFKNKYSAVSEHLADVLTLAETSKTFFGTKYDDTLNGSADGSIMFGDIGDDVLSGSSSIDIIYGDDGDDTLNGGAGNDELHGGTGTDTLCGGSGNDTYVFELGDGQDTIDENKADSNGDKISFGLGILPDDVKVTRDGNDMVLLIGTKGDSLRIVNQFTSTLYQIEFFEFVDGSVIDKSEYLGATITIKGSKKFSAPVDKATGKTILVGSYDDDEIYGNGRTDILRGGAGDDILHGGAGEDELYGGPGNDIMYGSADNDTYVFELGDGQDTINEEDADSNGDRVLFGEGIKLEDITVTKDGKDMVLLVGSAGDSLRIMNQFTNTYCQIESFEFADGTKLDKNDYFGTTIRIDVNGKFYNPDDKACGNTVLMGSDENDEIYGNSGTDIIYGREGNDTLYGGAGSDELRGGTGNDTLYGGLDNDTYIFELGDGQDTINEDKADSNGDRILFGEGIKPEDITVTRDGNDMVLLVGANGDSLRIVNQFISTVYQVENFEFADGTKFDKKEYIGATIRIYINGMFANPDDKATGTTILIGSEENDEIYGNGRTDIIYGGAGNDALYGGAGNDELRGGTGNDVLYGGAGNDTYVFELGDGKDTINEDKADSNGDKLLFGKGIMPEDITVTRDGNDIVLLVGTNGDSLRIVNQFTSTIYQVESFEFADGTVTDKKEYLGASITINGSGKFSNTNDKATGTTILRGSDENDEIYGSNRTDILYGGAGNDELHGGAGNDELHGGKGKDVLCGNADDDTYVFALGDGQDTINEEQSDSNGDRVLFGAGITPKDITVSRDGSDMVLLVGANGDSLRIVNQFTNTYDQVESFEFADGTKYDKKEYLGATITIKGSGRFSDPDDKATGTTILVGSDDDDEIYGNGRTDIIRGGEGSDTLYGGAGNDTLCGGAGKDVLCGNVGNDTYVFALGDGQDIINEENTGSTEDKVVFGAGIKREDITVEREENDMVLLVGKDGDSLRIIYQFSNGNYQVESFVFEDGIIAHIDLETSEFVVDYEEVVTTATTKTTVSTTTTAATTTAATTTTSAATTTAATTTTSTATATTVASAVAAGKTTVTANEKVEAYPLGDVNNDGTINAVDASAVLAYYALISTNQESNDDEAKKLAADVNHDGLINAVDASNILAYYAYVSTASGEIMSIEEYLAKK